MRMSLRRFTAVCLVGLGTAALAILEVRAQNGGARAARFKGDPGNTKYEAFDQIDQKNAGTLRVAWRHPAVAPELQQKYPELNVPRNFRSTPVMANGVLYASNGLGFVEAIDPSNGKTVWTQEPIEPGLDGLKGAQSARGVAYWSESGQERILSVRGNYLYALNAKSGKPVADFGTGGRVDLRPGLGPDTTAFNWVAPSPIIVRDVVIVGGQGRTSTPGEATIPPGDIRAFDVRNGRLKWQFHVVPRAGEFGVETWEKESWKYTGSGKAWSAMSVDEELGYVYVPTSSAANDWYGGERPGDNLFSDSLLCIDASTGKRVWHYQMVHHDLWDYDNPTAPILGDITVNGRTIKAVIQVTKHAFTFVFDRATGKPVWPIEERPVPQSSVPGEHTSRTQPYPSKPAPYDRQTFTVDDLIDFTPELRAEAIEISKTLVLGSMFTPPTLSSREPGGTRGTAYLPGWVGGANWGGAAFDPETGVLYVPSVTFPWVGGLVKGEDRFAYRNMSERLAERLGPQGLPLTRPPYGRITAIDLNTGEHVWMVPNGDGPRNHPLLKALHLPPLGNPGRAAPLLTRTLLFMGEGSPAGLSVPPGGGGPKFRAFDKKTGKVVAEIDLPAGTTGAPMTYVHNRTQYIVAAIAGTNYAPEFVALAVGAGSSSR
jgi:glucose dehydrogenase